MDENRSTDITLIIEKNLNLLIILYISTIMAHSLSGHIQENTALDFLARIDRVPAAAWKIPAVSIGLYGCCMLVSHIQNRDGSGLAVKVCIQLVICFSISYVIGFSYTGIALLVLADTIRHFPKTRSKLMLAVVVTVVCLFYLLLDCNLFSIYYEITPLEVYLEYYQKDVRSVLLGLKNVLSSLNMLVFIIYMILLVRTQLGEKERILNLNGKLNNANEELRQANIRLGNYAAESVEAAQTRERNRLAMEIHDTLGHALTGIITGIEACTVLMDAAPETTKVQLKAIAEVARQGVTDVRRSIKALRPDALEKMDLEEALTQMMEEMRRSTNVSILYQCTTALNCFNEDEENVIYRIVQESITNSIRHGKASCIWINIHREYDMLGIRVEDNGCGCADIQKGFGLHHMEERLGLLEGSLKYHGDNGFTVEAQIPIRWGTEEMDDD